MYSVPAYGKMLADGPRIEAYLTALRRAIKPGSVVVDLGSGPGLFALVACRLGARRVFAIEPDNTIQIGRNAAWEYGLTDRIEFIQGLSTKVNLPEPADVIVSDLRGVLPWFQQHLPSIIDARTRLLAPHGCLIPNRDRLWAAIVETPAKYDELVKPWEQAYEDVVLRSGRNLTVNHWSKFRVQPEDLLTEPVCWHELDYRRVEEINVSEEISFNVARGGTAHGLIAWFDAELIDGVGFSNAPGSELIYGNAFYPFQQPIDVAAGDQINVRLQAQLIGDDYTWNWNTTISSQGKTIDSFKQSTLLGAPLSTAQLRKRADTYVPEPNEKGTLAKFVLSRMDGKNSNEQIAAELMQHFSEQFRNHHEALDLVAEISDEYS